MCETIKAIRRDAGNYKVAIWLDKCGEVRTVSISVSYNSLIDPLMHLVITDKASPELQSLDNEAFLREAIKRLEIAFAGVFGYIYTPR